jgi:hypothetical protein
MSKAIEDLKLVEVYYGEDIGMVSLTLQRVLAYATDNPTFFSCVPAEACLDISSATMREYVGSCEHNWDDVVNYVCDHYDYKTKKLRPMKKPGEYYVVTCPETGRVYIYQENVDNNICEVFAINEREISSVNAEYIRIGLELHRQQHMDG